MHLVGYLYYWKMGFNSVFKGLNHPIRKKSCEWQFLTHVLDSEVEVRSGSPKFTSCCFFNFIIFQHYTGDQVAKVNRHKYGLSSSAYYIGLLPPSLWDLKAAYIDSCLPTFREDLSITSSRFKQSKMFTCSYLATQTKHVKYYIELLPPSLWDKAANIDSLYRRFGKIYRSLLQGSSSPKYSRARIWLPKRSTWNII